jgi:uncharacterized protein (TIGR03083 family)
VSPIDHRVWLATAVDRFEASIASADSAAPVESCPGWDVRALTEHVVGIHDWVSAIVRTGAAASAGQPSSPSGGAAELAAWYRAHADEMLALMAGADGDAACWNFSGVDLTYRFWPRRQTHEVTVHTVDVERAAGRDLAIDADIAADGIDEVLTVFAKRMADRGFGADVTAPIVLAPSDVDASWTVSPPDTPGGAVGVSAGADPQAAATVSAPASDLLLALWKRVGIECLEIAGERRVALAYLTSRLVP